IPTLALLLEFTPISRIDSSGFKPVAIADVSRSRADYRAPGRRIRGIRRRILVHPRPARVSEPVERIRIAGFESAPVVAAIEIAIAVAAAVAAVGIAPVVVAIERERAAAAAVALAVAHTVAIAVVVRLPLDVAPVDV